MSQPLKARIVAKQRENGKVEILTHCPQTGRNIATGMQVDRSQVESTVKKLQSQFERGGIHTEIIER